MLHRVNINQKWRSLIGLAEPDLHEKDLEILLRVIGLTIDGTSYKEPMANFLNVFARKARSISKEKIQLAERLFGAFFKAAETLTAADFATPGSGRFNIAVFEAVFRALCSSACENDNLDVRAIDGSMLAALKADEKFVAATQFGVGRTSFVQQRFERAQAVFGLA
ncbi:hypothetical protein ACFOON_11170 [Novosphingobium piscinae]|uniref:Uncharacterized protein n=1 Tax=Novosphingobium piscinae TaxID=1507448 RepID=A0A7X1KPC1_9SPHN|nr:hypothetical protein [Novosphingobium piscinae]MBC2668220.1 hypothetical protein [Novosphingobium piscinae]